MNIDVIPIDNENEKQYLCRDINVHDDDSRRDGRLTITSRRFLIEKKKGFQLIGKQKWIPLLDIDINDPIELSLDKRKKCVLIKTEKTEIKICAGDVSADKLLEEVQRNIDIARNSSRNNSFSSKKIIYDLKRERGIK